jgi:hypothetical protein
LDIRREIARIYVGDRRHNGGAGERQIAVPAQPLAVEDLTRDRDRSLGERCPSRPAEELPGAGEDPVRMRRIEKDHLVLGTQLA